MHSLVQFAQLAALAALRVFKAPTQQTFSQRMGKVIKAAIKVSR